MKNLQRMPSRYQETVLGFPFIEPTKREMTQANDRLTPFNLGDTPDRSQVVELPIPPLSLDQVIQESIEWVGLERIERATSFLDTPCPKAPNTVPYAPGWWRYDSGKWLALNIRDLDGDVLILDFETSKKDNFEDFLPGGISDNLGYQAWKGEEDSLWYPICCGGLSQRFGYVMWLANLKNMGSVIPSPKNAIIIGHNIQYDRQYLDVEYYYEDSGNRFIDTMASWVTVRGTCNQQRSILHSEDYNPGWTTETTTNGLDAVYKFYTGKKLNKDTRQNLVDQGLTWARQNFKQVLLYCLADIHATKTVFDHVYPELLNRQPSKLNLIGQLELGSAWLPLSATRWSGWYQRVEKYYQDSLTSISKQLKVLADDLVNQHLNTLVDIVKGSKSDTKVYYKTYCRKAEKVNQSVKNARTDGLIRAKVAEFVKTLPKCQQSLDWMPGKVGKSLGVPAWYRKTKDYTLSKRVSHALLKLTYMGEDVYWCNDRYRTDIEPIPHPEEDNKRVTNMFVKGFTKLFENDKIDTKNGNAKELVALSMSLTNWKSARERIKNLHVEYPGEYPIVLPQLVVTGTITRRAADHLFQVLCNPKTKRVGTEFKNMIEAPPGYVMVGADVDS